ncbi:MAG TPA: hypothetical protein VLC46_28545 [Thermoanaerobaculia bacterium]|nr:hypothetical protein [Thermoanaerobaculia bacterium]
MHIIPVFGSSIAGSDATYDSTLSLTNLTGTRGTVRVVRVLPLLVMPCVQACNPPFETSLDPFAASDGVGMLLTAGEGVYLRLGAVVLESDTTMQVDSYAVASLAPPRDYAQLVPSATAWIPGGTRSIIQRAFRGEGESFNLFLVNPNAAPMRFDYRIPGTSAAGFAVVAAGATAMVTLGPGFYCPDGCGTIIPPFGAGLPVEVIADGDYMAAVSNRSGSLPGIVRIASLE